MTDMIDEQGFVKNNGFLSIYIPAFDKAMVFRVIARQNPISTEMSYGSLPVKSGDTLNLYGGGISAVGEDGVLKGNTYTQPIQFPLVGAERDNDMMFTPFTYVNRLFHYKVKTSPSHLRIGYQIPHGASQGKFQDDKIIIGVEKEFGFERGESEMVYFPELTVGHVFGNDTNLDVNTSVTFNYAEYLIDFVWDPVALFNILSGLAPSYRITYPMVTDDQTVKNALIKTYQFDGFKIFTPYQQSEAIAEYTKVLEHLKKVTPLRRGK